MANKNAVTAENFPTDVYQSTCKGLSTLHDCDDRDIDANIRTKERLLSVGIST